ncbi:hypothetical protein V6N11_076405 [Hibiscus sabdariffa]|uniref:Protein transport protein SEC23 n=1 Tax=Hibiscus sabdariffa TaxID=183260 RepID=A0ABR2Q662_9ROSI
MDAIDSVFDPLREFAKDSFRLVKRCHKPDRKEFTKGFSSSSSLSLLTTLLLDPVRPVSHCSESVERLG